MPEMVGKQGQRTPTQRGFPPKEREMETNTDKYPRPNASMATDKDYRQEMNQHQDNSLLLLNLYTACKLKIHLDLRNQLS